MSVLRPFKAFRPSANFVKKVAALPYDVMNSEEARRMALGNPYSFLHVDKAEIDLPKTVDIYDKRVYDKAKENLSKLISADVVGQDEKPCLYIYEQTRRGRTQTGLAGCTSIDDYLNNVIKKHEFTRADKEADRICHVDTLDANTGPIFLTYRKNDNVAKILSRWKSENKPVYDFVSDDVRQIVWVIDSDEIITALTDVFSQIPALYIADGHHRAASAVKVGQKRREECAHYSGIEEFNFFLSVLFSSDELEIMDYNRVIADLNGFSEAEFIKAVSKSFDVEKIGLECYRPSNKHTFGMLLNKEWYSVTAKAGSFDDVDSVASLDVSILQNNLISPILGIDDPRTDKRIDFVGGIRGAQELEKRCESDMKIAFLMCPTTLDDLMKIADEGKVMPPKSTWFEPKLLSGLFIHFLH